MPNNTTTVDFAERVRLNQQKLCSDLKSHYDFVVCGSGSSGSVVARRLAENANVSVLLLEVGGDDDVPSVMDTDKWPLNLGSERDWGFHAQPDPRLNRRSIPLSMGKVLGGGSSINVMVWARGHKNDWDFFASEASDPAWSYESVLNIYRRVEDWHGSPDPRYRGPRQQQSAGSARRRRNATDAIPTGASRQVEAGSMNWTSQFAELPVGQREIRRMPRFGLPQFTSTWIVAPEQHTVRVGGSVAQPCAITLQDLASLLRRDQVSDFHCVATWTKRGVGWSGFRFRDVYEALIVPRAQPDSVAAAGYVIVSGLDGMRAGLPLADAPADDVLLADTMDGAPLPAEHGAPLRLLAPAHYGYKSMKHVSAIDFVATDFNYGFMSFIQHARGRVAYEERGRWVPGWLLRYVYRLMIAAGIRLARAKRTARASDA